MNVAPSPPTTSGKPSNAKPRTNLTTSLSTTDRADHSFWWMFYTHLTDQLRIADESVRDSLVAATRTSSNWDNMPSGTRAALERIRKKFRIGVISNADGKIAELLDRCGIAECFLSITDSGIMGREKPDPVIFHAALNELGATAQESLYVGDVYSVDYSRRHWRRNASHALRRCRRLSRQRIAASCVTFGAERHLGV